MQASQNEPLVWHGTTIVTVRKDGKVVIGGDGQVSIGQTVPSSAHDALSPVPARTLRRPRVDWSRIWFLLIGFASQIGCGLVRNDRMRSIGRVRYMMTSRARHRVTAETVGCVTGKTPCAPCTERRPAFQQVRGVLQTT
jgi:hypothetical protein